MWTFVVLDEFHWPVERREALFKFAGRVDQLVRGADEDQCPGPRRPKGKERSRHEGIRARHARAPDILGRHILVHGHVKNVVASLRLGVLTRVLKRLDGARRDDDDAAGRWSVGLQDEVSEHERCRAAVSPLSMFEGGGEGH